MDYTNKKLIDEAIEIRKGVLENSLIATSMLPWL